MITTELYKGQGLGNQLACYVATRVIAKDKNYEFGIKSPENFKGDDFLNLDFGKEVIGGIGPEGGPPTSLPNGIKYYYKERYIIHPENGSNITTFDKNLVNILDNTKIDGIIQGEQYIEHRKDEIREWLKVKKGQECYDFSDDNICVLNFRGGECSKVKDFFLPQKYWDDAVKNMKNINKNFKFIVITDDTETAKKFFPNFDIHHFSIAKDYIIIKNAKYLILSNSSFAWFPAWLSKELKYCIAPKYWGRHNTSNGFWACSYNITKGWSYQDREGNLNDYDSCLKELNEYKNKHKDYFFLPKIKNNFLVISNYNNDIRWVPEYTDNYLIYDRSDNYIIPKTINLKKVIKSPNVGYNLYDYFTFIIDNYEILPECTIFAKGNTFSRHVSRGHFEKIMNNNFFTPIEDYKRHETHWPICFFSSDGGFCEINNSWYLKQHPVKYFNNYNNFLEFCFNNPLIPRYIRFAPGANYIVPRENILKLPKVFYENLRIFVSHCRLPGEAHIIERALHTLWNCNFELNKKMLVPLNKNLVVLSTKKIKKDNLKLLKKILPVPIKMAIKKMIQLLKKRLPFPLKIIIIRLINDKRIFKKTRIDMTPTPEEELKIFSLLKNEFNTVFDVGARNDLAFYRIKNECSYHLFEPNMKFINLLKKQVKLIQNHKIKINEFGLSDKSKNNCIYYEKSQSFIPNPTYRKKCVDTGVRYPLKTLDEYVSKNNISKIDFLKIDTEGLDYKVILGGLKTLKNNKVSYIQFEYWDGIEKFTEILKNFNLYLIMEPVLLKIIKEKITPMMTPEQKQVNYQKSIIKLDENLIDLIDKKIIPTGNGGNVFGINKNIKKDVRKLIFDL